ncbi:MAG: 50S ribosomal protein L10 [Chloroflexia bacterium]
MPTARKESVVAELAEMLQRSNAVIVTDHRGLKVSDLTTLRRQLRERDTEYHITKNTLTSLAAQSAGIQGLESQLEGPTALAFVYGDPTASAKVLTDFARSSRILTIRAGLLDNRVISSEDVGSLANLEPREVLLAKVLGGLNAPAASFVGVLQASLNSLGYVLKARLDQLGGDAAPAAAE